MKDLQQSNYMYWQNYKPGQVPSIPKSPPESLLNKINGPILDVGTGDGSLAEGLSSRFNTYGIDIAKNIIEKNKKRNTRVIYSIDDISKKTNFENNFFDLVLFKFVLTNIHKPAWESTAEELFRIVKPGGYIWLLEPLVSESYLKRYELAKNFVEDQNCVYVFQEKSLAENIKTKSDLEEAINLNKVSRIIKHYTNEELEDIFSDFSLESSRVISVISPSGYSINTFEGIYKKAN